MLWVAHNGRTLSLVSGFGARQIHLQLTGGLRVALFCHRAAPSCWKHGRSSTSAARQLEWYRHNWRWPAARYQNLFQEMNAFKLATENSFMDDDTAVAELFGLDPRKVDRAQAVSKARKAALQSGPAADIIRAEVEKDELAVAEAFVKSDDDAVGLRKPIGRPRRG